MLAACRKSFGIKAVKKCLSKLLPLYNYFNDNS